MNILETINLEKIIMINEEEVKKFLSEHEEIANFLPKAFTELDKYFLENKFLLELYFSYEDEDYKQLIIYIRHNLDAKKAMDLLDEFCNKFWYESVPSPLLGIDLTPSEKMRCKRCKLEN